MCDRLRLADILVRPMQRLTKYGLLLTAIRKHVTDENDCEVMDSMVSVCPVLLETKSNQLSLFHVNTHTPKHTHIHTDLCVKCSLFVFVCYVTENFFRGNKNYCPDIAIIVRIIDIYGYG